MSYLINSKFLINGKHTSNNYSLTLDHNPPTLESNMGPLILREEVQAAISTLKEGNAQGPDGVQAEFIRLLDEEHLDWLTNIFNHVYHTGHIPTAWLSSEFVVLPKKPGAKQCSDYRTISLISHLLKLFLKIIHKRIYIKCEAKYHLRNLVSGTHSGLGRLCSVSRYYFRDVEI